MKFTNFIPLIKYSFSFSLYLTFFLSNALASSNNQPSLETKESIEGFHNAEKMHISERKDKFKFNGPTFESGGSTVRPIGHDHSSESKTNNWESRLELLESEMKLVKSENSDHKEELVILKKKVTRLNNKLSEMEARSCLNNSMNRETNTPVQKKASSGNSVTLPKSCDDLRQLGHKLSGIYPIQGEGINNNKVTLIFCQFSSSPSFPSVKNVNDNGMLKKELGYLNLKSLPNRVAFFVQKDNTESSGKTVSFSSAKLNDGGAMNLKQGIFTAPLPGTYVFQFSALVEGDILYVYLYRNDNMVGSAYNGQNNRHEMLGFSTILKLKIGDKISLRLGNKGHPGYIMDSVYHHTFFSGWLLDEDLTF